MAINGHLLSWLLCDCLLPLGKGWLVGYMIPVMGFALGLWGLKTKSRIFHCEWIFYQVWSSPSKNCNGLTRFQGRLVDDDLGHMYWTLLYLEYVHSTSLKSSLLKELRKSPESGLKKYLQGVLGLFKVLWEQVKECLRAFVLWQFLMYLEAWDFCGVGLQVSYVFLQLGTLCFWCCFFRNCYWRETVRGIWSSPLPNWSNET